jgi:hypothetical protein
MAYQYDGEGITMTLTAGEDLSADQYKFVYISAANTCILTDLVTDRPIGVLLNKPDAVGKAATVLVAGVTQVVAAGAFTAGRAISQNGAGLATPAAGGEVSGGGSANPVVGTSLTASGGANEIITCAVNCLNSQVTA